MPAQVTIKVSKNWGRWEKGFGKLGREFGSESRQVWQQVTDVMFDRSQQYAHILSGDNKASGWAETVVEGTELVGRITYDSDHAIYEEARGGTHAYLGRAWEATESMYRDALPDAWSAVIDLWR